MNTHEGRAKKVALILAMLGIIGLVNFLIGNFGHADKQLLWVYKSWKPFLAGWSETGMPLIDNKNIYACIGYGWWDNKVKIVALDKATGHEVWTYDINRRCEHFDLKDGKIEADVRYYTTEYIPNAKPGEGIKWYNKNVTLEAETGAVIQESAPYQGMLPKVNNGLFPRVSGSFSCQFHSEKIFFECINTKTGVVVFKPTENLSTYSMDVSNENVYYWPGGASPNTYRVDLNQPNVKQTYELVGSFIRIFGDKLLVTSDAKRVTVTNLINKQTVFTRSMDGWVKGFVVDGQFLYVEDDSGKVSAFKLQSDTNTDH